MKKILSVLLSVATMFSTFAISTNVFAFTSEDIFLGETKTFYFSNYDDENYDSEHRYIFTPSKSGFYEATMSFGGNETSEIQESFIDIINENNEMVDIGSYNYNKSACVLSVELKANYRYVFEANCYQKNQTIQFSVKEHIHTFKTYDTIKASTSYDGAIYQRCALCDYEKEIIIPQYKIKLNKNSLEYNGKVQKPTVSVIEKSGRKLVEGTDYTTSVEKAKGIGYYWANVKFIGQYSQKYDEDSARFAITPKSTSISKVSKGKKALSVTWKKQSSETTGYQIQVATDKNFKKNKKTVTISNKNKAKTTIGKLKSGKKYYVRVRTYTDQYFYNIYSQWSTIKTVKTK